jgi:hypothetical protein
MIDIRQYLDYKTADSDYEEALKLICRGCVVAHDIQTVRECESLLIATKEHREGYESKLIICLSDRARGTLTLFNGCETVYKDLVSITTLHNISKEA